MNITKRILLISSLLLSSQAMADEASRAEAEKFLNIIHMKTVLADAMNQMLELQLKQKPVLVPYKGVMLKFMQKYMGYDSLKEDMTKIYSEAFTAKELKEINAFYSTPTGQKTVEKLPALMSKGAQLGYQRVQQHSGELRDMIKAEAERIQSLQQSQKGG
ncbi:DUF2059 domain-containing protein [Gallaecimonas kandeliae]|uniref:DUF2059 domain-containing protein n=1 Tax=Gallaecimonas kandeliae TaxID=3029055 RepID=UPI0026497E3E|nr:DUF2059 domain-containing protein [Gallaecimonas kandeliae]WKE64802.1 DUF2059 domain-containing protein [Gallaecimonas kandeliae]